MELSWPEFLVSLGALVRLSPDFDTEPGARRDRSDRSDPSERPRQGRVCGVRRTVKQGGFKGKQLGARDKTHPTNSRCSGGLMIPPKNAALLVALSESTKQKRIWRIP